MEEIRSQLAANIRHYRNTNGMSVDEVGGHVGKKGKTISAWENGRGQPDADEIVILCRLFGVEIGELFGVSFDEASADDGQQPFDDDRFDEICNCFSRMSPKAKDVYVEIGRLFADSLGSEKD